MKWEDERQSSNVDDRRMDTNSKVHLSSNSLAVAIPIIRFLLKSKIGRIVLVVGVVAYFFGFNPLTLLNNTQTQKIINNTKDNHQAAFIKTVLAQTEDIWQNIFAKYGFRYKDPTLVLFRSSTQSGCGYASKQSGPFYCPSDQKIYLDLSFFDELKSRHNSPGDFAQAYVLAHEVGHHVQNMFGTLKKIRKKQNAVGKTRANALQVLVELQADCYAGIWAYYIQNEKHLLEDGDIQEALKAANAIGDDTLQKKSKGYVVPDSFTHGSSAQRMQWFKKGFNSGTFKACNTGINK